MLAEARGRGPGSAPARGAAQRELLLRAMTRAAAAKGYAGSRVEDVVELSGLSRATFYLALIPFVSSEVAEKEMRRCREG